MAVDALDIIGHALRGQLWTHGQPQSLFEEEGD
jgi:hypothetical protein